MVFKSVSFAQFFVVGILLLAVYNVGYTLTYTNGIISLTHSLWNPSWLLFGPFLYLAVNNRTQQLHFTKRLILHCLPFLIALGGFFVLKFWSGNDTNLLLFIKWYDGLFFVVPISLGWYVVMLLPVLKKEAVIEEGSADLFFLILAFFITLVLMIVIQYLCQHILKLETGINYYSYINYLLIAMVVFTLTFLVVKPQAKFINQQVNGAYAKSPLKPEQVKAYIQKIEGHFKNEQSFLQYNVTLESLSQALNISKPHLTQVFNIYLNKNFYTYLADYRIEYALSLIHHSNMTVEALAYECGFSSKTSFNRYFKANTGYSPIAYLNKKVEVS